MRSGLQPLPAGNRGRTSRKLDSPADSSCCKTNRTVHERRLMRAVRPPSADCSAQVHPALHRGADILRAKMACVHRAILRTSMKASPCAGLALPEIATPFQLAYDPWLPPARLRLRNRHLVSVLP